MSDTHFNPKRLADYFKWTQQNCAGKFKAAPFINRETDSLLYYTENESSYDDYISTDLSLFRSNHDGHVVGFEIRNLWENIELLLEYWETHSKKGPK